MKTVPDSAERCTSSAVRSFASRILELVKSERISALRLLAIGLFAAALGACGSGSTGAQGPQGPSGPPGPTVESADNALALHLTITGATIAATSTVAFKATDPDMDNELVTGIPLSTLEVIIAKLIPGTNGNADHWQNYINHTVQPYTSGQQAEVQPETDSGGSLEDNGDGTYTYTFGTNLTDVTQPIAVSYDPSLVHRIAINIRSSTLPSANDAIYTWIPATGKSWKQPRATSATINWRCMVVRGRIPRSACSAITRATRR